MKKHSLPIFIFVALMTVYAFTLAPGLTWANRGADGGDLITAAATGGVAHPSGYPTYLALARLFQWLPWGSLAFRTNLLSAFCAALTAVVVAKLAEQNYSGQSVIVGRIAGLVAGLGFGLSPLFWSQAVITEVYTLHMLFMALILYYMPLIANETKPLNHTWLDRISGLLFGLALGNQITVAFLLLPWLLLSAFNKKDMDCRFGVSFKSVLICVQNVNWPVLIRRTGWLLVGLLIYLTIPLRAHSGSPVNWGNPENLKNLWWLVSGQLYQDRVFALAPEFIVPRIRNWAGLLQTQFGLLGLALGFYGLFYGKPRAKQFFWITGWIFIAYTAFSIGYNSTDSYALLIPAFLAFALWLGLGAATLLELMLQSLLKAWAFPLGIVLTLLIVLINAGVQYTQVDARYDHRAEDFGRDVFSIAPQGAIIITEEDRDTFALWYAHFALGQRADLIVLNRGLLIFDWYRDAMRQTYPGLTLSDQADCSTCMMDVIAKANIGPVCETHVDEQKLLICLP